MKSSLFLAGTVIALSTVFTPGASIAALRYPPTTVLWNQNSNFGSSINSQNFTSGSFPTYDNSAADDFVVPAGMTWKITGVDVTGNYGSDHGPATSEIITFYRNKGGFPGTVIGTPQTMKCTDTGGSFACKLPTAVKLKGGTTGKTYWIGFVVNQPDRYGLWYWTENTTIHGNEATWENPGGGYGVGCTTWTAVGSCFSGSTGDMAFDLKGRSSGSLRGPVGKVI